MSITDPKKAGDAVVYYDVPNPAPWWAFWRDTTFTKSGWCLRCMLRFDANGDAILGSNSILTKYPKYMLCHHMKGGIGDGTLWTNFGKLLNYD